MPKITDKDGNVYSVKFYYKHNSENDPSAVVNLLADHRTYCSMKKLSTGEFISAYSDCSKKDKYNKRLGMRKAFERCVAKITDDKDSRFILWQGFFENFHDPNRDNFFRYAYCLG